MKHKFLIYTAGLLLLMLFTASAKAGPIGVTFHDSTVVGGTQFDYPIYLDSMVTGMNVISYQIEFTFNNSLFSFVSAQTNGTMSNGWTMDVNTVSPGRIRVAAIGSALSGNGKLIVLQFSTNVFPYNNGAYFTFQSIL
ncbi:MAG: cohesin domain-containing protein, partial [Bacteroidota bacterium]